MSHSSTVLQRPKIFQFYKNSIFCPKSFHFILKTKKAKTFMLRAWIFLFMDVTNFNFEFSYWASSCLHGFYYIKFEFSYWPSTFVHGCFYFNFDVTNWTRRHRLEMTRGLCSLQYCSPLLFFQIQIFKSL